MAERNPIQKYVGATSHSYNYGVEKLWILNVGDLKPMEYPITFFMDMAWNPKQFNVSQLAGSSPSFLRTAVWRRSSG
jgi:hypothetical protein